MFKRVYENFTMDSWLVGLALLALGMSLAALGMTGCSDSGFDPHHDPTGEPCNTHEECGEGWVCGNDAFEGVCARAYDGVNGVFADKIVIGNSSGHKTGRATATSLAVVNGIQAFIKRANEQLTDGIHGRKIMLDLRDNGYTGEQAKSDTEDMTNPDGNRSRKVFAIVGNVGEPPAAEAEPIASANKTVFFAPVAGGAFLRRSPPSRYTFNYRVSYAQQAEAGARWMAETRKEGTIAPPNIAVFAQGLSDGGQDGCTWDAAGASTCLDAVEYRKRVEQLDGFGVAGYDGVVQYLTKRHGLENNEVIFASHDRTSVNVDKAVERFLRWLSRPKRGAAAGQDFDAGILLQVVTSPAASLVQHLRDTIADVKAGGAPASKYGTFTQQELDEIKKVRDLVFAGTWIGSAFARAMKDFGYNGRYCRDIMALEVVPHPAQAQSRLAIEYREALKALDSALQPDVFSFEGYIAMKLFTAGLERLGRDVSTESLVDTLESMSTIDIGLGVDLGLSGADHQASQSNWAQTLTDQCELAEFDL